MPSKIEETYCVQVGEVWCAVLGNHYPNFLQKVDEEFNGLVEGGLTGVFVGEKTWCTQRLCDQQLVQYKLVMLQAPTCPECLRIKALMVEFGDIGNKEQEVDEPAADAEWEGRVGGRGDAGEAVGPGDADGGGPRGEDVVREDEPQATAVG